MSVSNIGSTAGLSQLQWRSTVRQARQDFEQLFQSMQSGDLSGAQQAYSALQQLQPNASSGTAATGTSTDATSSTASAATTSSISATSSSTTTTAGNTIASDWTALGQALQSGNLSSAQGAFSQLEQDLQSSAQGAGHRHHHHEVDQAQAVYSAMQTMNANGATGTGSGNSGNSIASDISALKQALRSGDTTSAQNLLTQLQNDLQASGQVQGHGHHHHRGFALQSPVAAYNDASTTAAVTPASSTAGSTSSTTTTA